MRLRVSVPAQLGLLALLVLSIFAWAPALFPGYWEALEGFVPVFNVAQPAPFAAVATAPDLWRSAGGATFLFPRAFVLIGFTPVEAVRYTFVVAFLLGACGIYAWLRPRMGDLAAGIAGLIYVLLPIFLATVYVRGSLADALVLGILPLALAGLAAYERQRSLVGAAIAVLTIVWIWRTQAGLAVFVTLLLLLYAIVVERNWVTLLIAGVAAAAGIVSLLPDLNVAAPAATNFYDHFLYLHQLFAVDWNTTTSTAGWQDGYPFQLGFAAFAFSIVALWVWWRRRPRPARDIERLLAFAWIGALVVLGLTFSFSEPLWRLTGADRFLTYPWQLMLLVAPLLAVTAGALPALAVGLRAPAYWVALVGLVLLSSYPSLTAAYTEVVPPDRPVAVFGDHQVAILKADLVQGADPGKAQLDVVFQVLRPLDVDYNVFFQALTGAADAEQVLAQLDAQPLGTERPATSWRPGEILSASYELDLANAPAGVPLRYYFGFYDWRDGRRMVVDDGIDDKLVIYGQ